MSVQKSITLDMYKSTMMECMKLYMPQAPEAEISKAIDYSISKRYKEEPATVLNSYTNINTDYNLLKLADYIHERRPIVTAFGTMFERHANSRNPLAEVVQGFLDQRTIDKKMMFKFPKGSEMFEHYNLLQQLDKIDANGIYGILGMYTSLVFNVNVATSITAQGRSLISSAIMQFEMFLANNVKFGSLDQVLQFINNVIKEKPYRKYNDYNLLDNPNEITPATCFAKLVMDSGYRWVPDESEMEVIWRTVNNLSQEDLNRVYYKNNLYEFMSNSSMIKAVRYIMQKLESPFMNPLKPPKEVIPELDEFSSILMEYIYYGYQIIDRTDRARYMIRSVVMLSDTDSAIVSLDAWYRFILEYTKDLNLDISYTPVSPIYFYDKDEFGDIVDKRYQRPFHFEKPEYDYDFFSDELIEMEHITNPIVELPQDNIRHTILNILAYVLDKIMNDYMLRYTMNNNSFDTSRSCKIILKNEFTFRRALLTSVMKSYATLQELQEGNIVPQNKQLDIKGIASMAKSSMADSTRDALKQILLEDILKAPVIDQFTIVKKISVLEKEIIDSLYKGSKKFYKPVTIKAKGTYKDPMRIQGVKASTVWNRLVEDDLPNIDLNARNAIDIAKVKIDSSSIEKIRESFPNVYERAKVLLPEKDFKGHIDSIAIPLDVDVPQWLLELIDYNQLINDNISGFVYESVGINRMQSSKVNYTNTLQL